jgi:hypothetical protein
LLITLSINFLHHPLLGNQTKTSVTFGCGYLIDCSLELTNSMLQLATSSSTPSITHILTLGEPQILWYFSTSQSKLIQVDKMNAGMEC